MSTATILTTLNNLVSYVKLTVYPLLTNTYSLLTTINTNIITVNQNLLNKSSSIAQQITNTSNTIISTITNTLTNTLTHMINTSATNTVNTIIGKISGDTSSIASKLDLILAKLNKLDVLENEILAQKTTLDSIEQKITGLQGITTSLQTNTDALQLSINSVQTNIVSNIVANLVSKIDFNTLTANIIQRLEHNAITEQNIQNHLDEFKKQSLETSTTILNNLANYNLTMTKQILTSILSQISQQLDHGVNAQNQRFMDTHKEFAIALTDLLNNELKKSFYINVTESKNKMVDIIREVVEQNLKTEVDTLDDINKKMKKNNQQLDQNSYDLSRYIDKQKQVIANIKYITDATDLIKSSINSRGSSLLRNI